MYSLYKAFQNLIICYYYKIVFLKNIPSSFMCNIVKGESGELSAHMVQGWSSGPQVVMYLKKKDFFNFFHFLNHKSRSKLLNAPKKYVWSRSRKAKKFEKVKNRDLNVAVLSTKHCYAEFSVFFPPKPKSDVFESTLSDTDLCVACFLRPQKACWVFSSSAFHPLTAL